MSGVHTPYWEDRAKRAERELAEARAEIEQKNAELAAFSGWYVMWENQIPKAARDAIEVRLKRIDSGTTKEPDGFKCVHCGYIGDVSEPPHVCEEGSGAF